tara:strand:+ start:306 stop:1622 length:1317 start_codon:yes stop_codon:yes gene_type:complete
MPFVSASAISPYNSIRGGAAGGVVQLPFITSWNTANTGVSDTNQVKLPILTGSTVDFSINWGDGNIETITSIPASGVTHTYDSEGTYTVEMLGSCEGWTFENGGDKEKLLDISQWGTLFDAITNDGAFKNCYNMNITATDGVKFTTLYEMFMSDSNNGSIVGNTGIELWDVSECTSGYKTFRGQVTLVDRDFSSWDTSGFTNMQQMFYRADDFVNPSFNDWDVSNVTDFSFFVGGDYSVSLLYQPTFENWDTSSALTFGRFAFKQRYFNGDIDHFKTSQITVSNGFSNMFELNLSNFNPNFVYDPSVDVDVWNVSNATYFVNMFRDCRVMTGGFLATWDTSSAISFQNMFYFCRNLEGELFGDWDVSNLTTAQNMFLNGNLDTDTYDHLLIGWAAQEVNENVLFHAGNSNYTPGGEAEDARDTLINNYNWTITDSGPA